MQHSYKWFAKDLPLKKNTEAIIYMALRSEVTNCWLSNDVHVKCHSHENPTFSTAHQGDNYTLKIP